MKHLTHGQLAMLTGRLADRTRELVSRVREELAHSEDRRYSDLVGTVLDAADESVASMLADQDIGLIKYQVMELRDVEAAQKRIADHVFGICIDCSEDIPFERLNAYPTAKRCIRCQQRHERKAGSAGRSGMART